MLGLCWSNVTELWLLCVYISLVHGVLWFMLIRRENEQLSKYGDTKSARAIMLAELKKLIEANPLFRDKLQFPTLKNSRLRTLINQRSHILVSRFYT